MQNVKLRELTYCEAINEAIIQEMKKNSNILVYGLEDKVFGSTKI